MKYRRVVFLLCWALLLPLSPLAAAAAPALSTWLSGDLGQMRLLTEAKDYAGALERLSPVLARTKPDSYDRYVLLQIQGRLQLTLNRYAEALASLEQVDALGQRHPDYVDASGRAESLQILAQLSYQLADSHRSSDDKRAGYRRALAYAGRWQAALKAPDANALYFVATLDYQFATLLPEHPDHAELARALEAARDGLLASAEPPDSLRLLVVAILQQLDRIEESVPQLEWLVTRQPKNAALWRQLSNTYLTLANRQPTEPGWNLRAILTLRRAAENGFLTDSNSRLYLVHACLQADAWEQALQLLSTGLESGAIDSTARSWRFLASLEQEHGSPKQALATLREAARRYPEDTSLALELARQLHAQGEIDAAYEVAKGAAREPGRLAQPGHAFTYLAYLAYELNRREAALHYLETAETFSDARRDDIRRLRAILK